MIKNLVTYLSGKLKKAGIASDPKLVSQVLLILTVGAAAAGAVTIWNSLIATESLTEISRPKGNDDSYQVTLETSGDDGTRKEVMLTVPEREYDAEMIRRWFQKGKSEIETLIRGENISLDHVDSKLNLITELPDTGVSVSWVSSDNAVLDWEGNIGSEVPENGAEVTLYVTFDCQSQMEEFELQLKIFPPGDEKVTWNQRVQKSFEEANQGNSGTVLYLPEEIDGEKISWGYPVRRTGTGILIITVLLAAILLIGKQQEQKQTKEKEDEQMMTDYPEILNKFTLLLNAGMNSRKALAKVALDYRKEGSQPRAAYEAIVAAYIEMEQGIPEAEAYEHLGIRCGLPAYRTFATLLVQNLRKGNRELVETMEREAVLAFENRKRRAKVLGEKAGTKLLMPMMCMLIIVFVILLVPAWNSFM